MSGPTGPIGPFECPTGTISVQIGAASHEARHPKRPMNFWLCGTVAALTNNYNIIS